MALAALKKIVIPARTKHTATVIFVHGLGDTGHGLKPLADMFREDPALHHVKWVLPHSPIRTVTANMGIEMPSWFDIYSFGFNTEEDEKAMLESASSINQLITAEVDDGIEPGRIILGGFSQGGTMSILTGLTGERKLGGICVLSGWLPLRNKFKSMAGPHVSSTPIFWGHGAIDPLVTMQMTKDSVEFLTKTLGIPEADTSGTPKGLEYHRYENLGHSTTHQELEDIKAWLIKAVPDSTDATAPST
ncbi:hypothetical protein D9611_002680 [Ephemerocybe angulata]|uniref:Acyl-protein thioesterase 1 n=1 Tax=Ephemerocybe angulata TaxID=980116 RepID=A0A8H5FDU1_9AGAR|nr:hypothetical protein D9611_002680 [Tulosesus angulatus]